MRSQISWRISAVRAGAALVDSLNTAAKESRGRTAERGHHQVEGRGQVQFKGDVAPRGVGLERHVTADADEGAYGHRDDGGQVASEACEGRRGGGGQADEGAGPGSLAALGWAAVLSSHAAPPTDEVDQRADQDGEGDGQEEVQHVAFAGLEAPASLPGRLREDPQGDVLACGA